MPVRLRSSRLPLALLLASLGSTTAARASDPCQAAPLLSTCINSDSLWPHAGPQRFATVGGVETVDAGHFGFGLVSDYISRPIVFHIASPGAGGSNQNAIDDQVNGNFLWAYGVTRRLELDVALPVTFGQTGSGASPVTGSTVPIHTTAMRDLRFGFAYQLVAHDAVPDVARAEDYPRVWGVTARMEVSAPTGDRDDFAGESTAVFIPSIAADYRQGRWFAGAEIGGRIRPDAQAVGANMGPQGMVALGIGYDLLKRPDLLGLMAEARTLPTFATQYTPYQSAEGITETSNTSFLSPSEWMVSLRSAPLATNDLSLTAGGGGAIPTGDAITVPRWRFLLGIRFAPVAGVAVHHEPSPPVAPMPATAAPPVVRLDLSSAPDRCKDEPDTVDGFKDDDGCPDEDTDKDGVDDRYDRCPLVSEDFAGLTDGCPEGKPTPPPATPAPNP